MRWPREIVTAFMQAVDIELANGTSKEAIIVGMLDLAARRGRRQGVERFVWRVARRRRRLRATRFDPGRSPPGCGPDAGRSNPCRRESAEARRSSTTAATRRRGPDRPAAPGSPGRGGGAGL